MSRRTDLETLKSRIVDAVDADDVLTRLCITVEDLLEAFEDRLLAYRDEFSDLEDPEYD